MKKFKRAILIALTLSTLLSQSAFCLDKQNAVVAEALTGDTVRLKGGKLLKYIGLQAPPLQSKIPLLRTYGENSLAYNKSLVEGKSVMIEWGNQIRDERDELLGYVFLEDGRFVNLEILKAGHARALNPSPNLKYAADLRLAALSAQRQKSGLWKETPDNPYITSEYIGEKNTKIYYFPTSLELDRIPQANLVKFRSRVEAKAAGYRPCSTCREGDRDWDNS